MLCRLPAIRFPVSVTNEPGLTFYAPGFLLVFVRSLHGGLRYRIPPSRAFFKKKRIIKGKQPKTWQNAFFEFRNVAMDGA